MIPTSSPGKSHFATAPLVAAVLVCAILAGVYWTARYAGWAMEVDAARQAVSADGTLATGRLVHHRSYDNGFGYSSALAFVSAVTGLPVETVQLGSGLWLFMVAAAALVTYREFLGGIPAAALATLLLLIQPDFLFYVLRGSHEKYTWTLALLMLFLLARSYRDSGRLKDFAIYVGLFYLAFAGMEAANVFFGSTFATTVVISFLAGWVLTRLGVRAAAGHGGQISRRLMLIGLTCYLLVFIFVYYLYRPALQYFSIVASFLDRITLLLGGGQAAVTPATYDYLGVIWRSLTIYLALTAIQWAIAILGFAAWVRMTLHLKRLSEMQWLLWLMYTGFGVQLVYGIAADFAGFLNANMQLRLFTPLCLFSSPLAATLIIDGYARLRGRWQRIIPVAAAVVAAYALVTTLMKVSNEPLLSNQWLFYSPAELRTMEWVGDKVAGRLVWLETSEHLFRTLEFWNGYEKPLAWNYTYGRDPSPRDYVLLSTLTRASANRIGTTVPRTADHDLVYDNGTAQLYHPRPATPYQR